MIHRIRSWSSRFASPKYQDNVRIGVQASISCRLRNGCSCRPANQVIKPYTPVTKTRTYMHVVEAFVDLGERAVVSDVFINLDLALKVVW